MSMKKNVAIGILRAWIAFGIIFVPVVAIYIEEQTRSVSRRGSSASSAGDGWFAFIVGCIVVIVGFFLLRWVISALANA